jgi:hypothetical protein
VNPQNQAKLRRKIAGACSAAIAKNGYATAATAEPAGSAPGRDGGQSPVGFGGVEACGIELAAVLDAEPAEHVLVFHVAGIGENLDQARIPR